MLWLSINISFVFGLIISLYVEPIESYKLKPKLKLLKRESKKAADAVRKICIKSPQGGVQLTSMASEFVISLNYATSDLNTVVLNAPCKERTLLTVTAQLTSNLVNGVQYVLFDKADELKEKLGETLEGIAAFVEEFEEDLAGSSNIFVNNQLKNVLNYLLYATFKLEQQATLFDTPNDGFEVELRKNEALLKETLACLSSTDEETEDEIRHILLHSASINSRTVSRLQNWIQVNANNPEGVKILQDVLDIGSELFEQENDAAKSQCIEHMKAEVLKIYAVVIRLTLEEVSRVKYADNTGGQEFLRSSIFDVVTVGVAYAETLKSCLLQDSTKTKTTV